MTKAQEARRKYVECLFGVLPGRFKILRNEFHKWNSDDITEIVHTCVIIHNMIVELHTTGSLTEEFDEAGNLLDSQAVMQEFTHTERIESGRDTADNPQPILTSQNGSTSY